MERVVMAVLGEEGDEGGVGDDIGGREGEEEAKGVGEEVEFEVSGDEGVGEMGVFFIAFEEHGVDGLGEVGVARAKGHVEGVEEGVGLWGKGTAQSCPAVAVLVATVALAAAYTVPGGVNDNGVPVFLDSPLFLFFTITDVAALACSLVSVMMLI
ncbi:hypothetical protein JHK87_001161 [Glycine soja]|nr:hypothetical protein JHK87_001161 [Glycine soja]